LPDAKKIKIGRREVEVRPELGERPPLGPVVAEVRINVPWWRWRAYRRTTAFMNALVAAFRIRARDEADLTVNGDGDRVVVRRRFADGSDEVRFAREGPARATLYCDRRELENLHALGLLAKAQVAWPKKQAGA
jgi:hypothetical protein